MAIRHREPKTTISEIIKDCIREKGTSQAKVANALGYTATNGVNERLRGDMRMGGVFKMLDCLGYDIVIRDRKGEMRDKIVQAIEDYDEFPELEDADEFPELEDIG